MLRRRGLAKTPLALALLTIAAVALVACDGGGDSTISLPATDTPTDLTDRFDPITDEMIWNVDPEVTAKLRACQLDVRTTCALDVMHDAGASSASIQFFEEHGGLLVWMDELGVIDLGQVYYPWRAHSNIQMVLLNGKPNVVRTEGIDIELNPVDPVYDLLSDVYPRLLVWPEEVGLQAHETSEKGQTFIFDWFQEKL